MGSAARPARWSRSSRRAISPSASGLPSAASTHRCATARSVSGPSMAIASSTLRPLQLDGLETGVVEGRSASVRSFGDDRNDGLVGQSPECERERRARCARRPTGRRRSAAATVSRSLAAARAASVAPATVSLPCVDPDPTASASTCACGAGTSTLQCPHRLHQRGETGVGQLRVGLRTREADDGRGGLRCQPVEQRGLADAGLAAQPDGDARATVEIAEHPAQQVELRTAADNVRRTLPDCPFRPLWSRRRHPSSKRSCYSPERLTTKLIAR